MKLLKKFRKIKKTLLALFLSSNLLLISTGSAQLDIATDSANVSTSSTSSASLVSSPTPATLAQSDDVLFEKPSDWVKKVTKMTNFIEDEIVVTFKEGVTDDVQREIIKSNNLTVVRNWSKLNARVLKVDPSLREQILANLANNPSVKYAEQRLIARSDGGGGFVGGVGGGYGTGGSSCTPNDPLFCNPADNQWGLKEISAPSGWGLNKGSSSVTVAVLDSGIFYDHFDLRLVQNGGRVYKGLDLSGPIGVINDCKDDNGHGTQTAGIIGALTNNNWDIAAVDWYAKLVCIKIAATAADGDALTTPDLMAAGIREALDPTARSDGPTPPPAKIINISFSFSGDSGLLRDAVAYARSRGAVIVASTEWRNPNSPNCFMGFPAAYFDVVSVGAVKKDLSWFPSCTGRMHSGNQYQELVLSAPGDQIVTLNSDGTTSTGAFGTSPAAAFVSGVASILASCTPNGDPFLIRTALRVGARDLGTTGWDSTFGYGLVNLFQALNASCY